MPIESKQLMAFINGHVAVWRAISTTIFTDLEGKKSIILKVINKMDLTEGKPMALAEIAIPVDHEINLVKMEAPEIFRPAPENVEYVEA